jgi:formylglycine-generating enzyme required for sulfatase activity
VIPDPVPYESIALASDSSYTSARVSDGVQPGEIREFTKLKIRFCWCPAGSFQMGSREDAPGHLLNETQFEVTLSKGFWMQQTELTQDQYERLMGTNPAFYKGPRNPVDSVTWTEAAEFCRRLSALPPEKRAGNQFRLPTEAEWEYACRSGSTTEFCYGDDEAGLDNYGWYGRNSARSTHPVGEKLANAWGLYDMHGNVSEWCQDFYGAYPHKATDPRGPASGEKRTHRGGGWFFVPMYARSAHRDAYIPSARYVGLGFRLVATKTSETGLAGQP